MFRFIYSTLVLFVKQSDIVKTIVEAILHGMKIQNYVVFTQQNSLF